MRGLLTEVLAADPNHVAARILMSHHSTQALQRTVESEFADLISESPADRRRALDVIRGVATEHHLPELLAHARRVEKQAFRARAARRRVVLEYRGTQSTVTGAQVRPISLGIGAPVGVQLPEIKTVRIATTVAVPVADQ